MFRYKCQIMGKSIEFKDIQQWETTCESIKKEKVLYIDLNFIYFTTIKYDISSSIAIKQWTGGVLKCLNTQT